MMRQRFVSLCNAPFRSIEGGSTVTTYANRDSKSGLFQLYGDDESWCTVANAFLEAARARGLAPETIRAYAFDLVILFRWMEEFGTCIEDLHELSLLEFIKHQRATGAEPTSINRRLTTSRLFYRFATSADLEAGSGVAQAAHYKGRGRDRHLGLHQLRRLRHTKLRVKTPKKVVEPLEKEQVLAFLHSLARYRDLAIVSLMVFCGLRSKEVVSVRLSDVNLLEGRLRVHGKGNIERVLPLPRQLLTIIADYNRLERPAKTIDDHLFVVLQGSKRGRPMTLAGVRSIFRHRRTYNADLANANPHRFRHTFGADMARSGVRLPILQKMMGHADAKTTLQYVNLSMSDVAEEFMKAAETVRRRYEET
jgi:site-specific recombinase XerD